VSEGYHRDARIGRPPPLSQQMLQTLLQSETPTAHPVAASIESHHTKDQNSEHSSKIQAKHKDQAPMLIRFPIWLN